MFAIVLRLRPSCVPDWIRSLLVIESTCRQSSTAGCRRMLRLCTSCRGAGEPRSWIRPTISSVTSISRPGHGGRLPGLSRQILLARARVGTLEPGEEFAAVHGRRPRIRPDQGHDSALLSVSAGWRSGDWQDGNVFVDLRLRPAFHSLMDDGGGFPSTCRLGFSTRSFGLPEPGRVRLQQLVFSKLSR